MASYDYKKGKERIEDILDNELKVIEQIQLLLFQMVIIVGLVQYLLICEIPLRCLLMRIKKKFQK